MSSPPADDFLVIAPSTRASAVIIHEVPDERGAAFLERQRALTAVVRHFPGYERTVVFPPEPNTGGRWVTLLHFQTRPDLERWLDSPERGACLRDLRQDFGDFTLRHLGRFDAWFSQNLDPGQVPGWKMALTVLLALYPTVMCLQIVLAPLLAEVNFSARMLISNAASVAILQWLMMPAATLILAGWLKPNASWRRSLAGVAGMSVVLTALLAFFSRLLD
ncbi:MAG: antibiotic biosynthesis monooxygenase [Gemmataceae bacterium]